MAQEKDPGDYAEKMLKALADPEQASHFQIADAEVDGVPVAFIMYTKNGQEKPVALVLTEGLDTLQSIIEAGEAADDEEDDEEDGDVVEGFVVYKGGKPRRTRFSP